MTNETILFLVLLVILLGVLPSWPHSSSWGYGPTGALTILLVVFLIWAFADHRPLFRSTGHDISDTAHDIGSDIKASGRDVADSIRRTVQ